MTLQEIRAARATAFARAQAIEKKAVDEGRDLTDDETSAIDAALDECGKFDEQEAEIQAEAEAARKQRMDAARQKVSAPAAPRATPAQPTNGDPVKVRERSQDDPKRGFKDAGDFYRSIGLASMSNGLYSDERLKLLDATGMSQGTGSDGGILVPPEFRTEIWDGLNAMAENMLGFTDQYTVTGESVTFNANAETSRANGSRFGGVQGYWIAEAGTITASKPTMRQVKLEPHELAVLVYATDKLIRNAGPTLGQFITRAATEEINFLIGDAIFNGDGAGKPRGFIGHNSVVSVAKEAGQAATTVVKANIDKMWSRCHARARAGAVWFINQDVEPQLEALAADVGTGGVPVYLPPGGIADTPNARLKGRPVIVTEFNATLGTVGDIVLANLGFYATALRSTGVDAASSIHVRFVNAETAFRFMFAVDGQPWLASPLTPFKGSNTLSPIVTLATRS